MPPNNSDLLQGLNLIQPPSTPTPSTTDTDILSAGPYGDLAAQLDLWTNVSFASDEPFVPGQELNDGSDPTSGKKDLDMRGAVGEVLKRKRDTHASKKIYPFQQPQQVSAMAALASTPTAPYDLSALLGMAAAGNQFPPTQSMNLNQLLALQAFPNPFHAAFGAGGAIPSFTQSTPFPPTTMAAPPPAPSTPAASKVETTPPTKRTKTSRKSSTTVSARASTAPSEAPEGSQADADEDHEDNQEGESSSGRPSGNMTEDKRRRNTQASARFRLKKKEREHAMEARSKELEIKVGELEKECEALRRENGWLKGLVVGVTGGGGMPMSVTMPTGPMLPPTTPSSTSTKRKRSDATEP
ncbi:hypothetical protein FRB95_003030 [Tulasnella sp. JGI-2019a]|nr:hypothetical protein FRB93_005757 [Tulasnella sp. JGI-2019a]KAG9038102.1 hypothetical protein FRB95_003030 [Tulasnella sp. JGI-2019a]